MKKYGAVPTLLLTLVALVAMCFCTTPSAPPDLGDGAGQAGHVYLNGASFGPSPRLAPKRHAIPVDRMQEEADRRTDAQKAAAACAGGWCKGAALPRTFAAGGPNPIIPASWTIGAWSVDPSNSIGCASDTNSGTSATCSGGCSGAVCPSGIGPLKTWGELNVHRWGCQGSPRGCPRLRQTTAITFLSSHTDNTDPVYFFPTIENGAVVSIQGALPTALCSGTFSGATITAKNNATPQLTNLQLCSSAALGDLIINTTHPSVAWAYKLATTGACVSGTLCYNVSQPLAPGGIPQSGGAAEVQWTAGGNNGDAYSIVAPTAVNLVDVEPIQSDFNGAFDNIVYLVRLTTFDPGSLGNNLFIDHAALVESRVNRYLTYKSAMGEASTNYGTGVYNVWNAEGLSGGGDSSWYFWIHGGVLASTAFAWNSTWMQIDGDFINAFGGIPEQVILGSMYIETAKKLQPSLFVSMLGPVNGGDGQNVLWGPGAIDMVANGAVLELQTGAGAAAAALKLTGAITLNGASTGYSICGTTFNSGINITAANIDAACGVAGFGGVVWEPTGVLIVKGTP